MADFRDLKVREVLDNEEYKAVIEKYAPSIVRSSAAKLMGKKSCGEVFDMVISKDPASKETVEKIAQEINELLKE